MPPQSEKPGSEKPINLSQLPEDIRELVVTMRSLKTAQDWANATTNWPNDRKQVVAGLRMKKQKERNEGVRKLLKKFMEQIDEGTEPTENLPIKIMVAIACLSDEELELAYAGLIQNLKP